MWQDLDLWQNDRNFVSLFTHTRIVNLLSRNGKISLAMNRLRFNGKLMVKDLSSADLASVERFVITQQALKALKALKGINIPRNANVNLYPQKKALKDLTTLTSKEIRT